MRNKSAFTLAEVLITLGIIGVVAALTLPTLIVKQKEKEIAVKLKKFNSMMNQSFQLAVKEYGEIDTWGIGTAGTGYETTEEEIKQAGINAQKMLDRLTKNLKVLSKCDYGESCETHTRYALQGDEYSTLVTRVILPDGITINGTTINDSECKRNIGSTKPLQNVCGGIFVDINGPKAPNATGRDVFLFNITKYGIVPMGSQSENTNRGLSKDFNRYCNMTRYNDQRLNGFGCTAWVMENENMDYLRCNDLSWEGKRKCK